MIKVIAELGQGYEGNAEYGKLLTRAAIGARANIVKFQLVFADDLATPENVHYELFKSLELTFNDWKEIKKITDNSDSDLCLDVFGEKSLGLASKLGVNYIKIHPTDINNKWLLNEIANLGFENVIIGVGGASKTEIEAALNSISNHIKNIVLLLGFQSYPTPNMDNQINRLKIIRSITETYSNTKFGFADHVVDDYYYSALLHAMAMALGASYFEKHLSLGNAVQLEDYESAIQPDQFKAFASILTKAEEALGTTENSEFFGMSEKELQYRKNTRRTWVAKEDLEPGEEISLSNISFKRSGESVENDLIKILGKKVKKKILIHQPILLDNLL